MIFTKSILILRESYKEAYILRTLASRAGFGFQVNVSFVC